MSKAKHEKLKWELRYIDAWADGEGGWDWNASYKVCDFTTRGKHLKRAFARNLRAQGVEPKRGVFRIDYDGTMMELCVRRDGQPVYAALPIS